MDPATQGQVFKPAKSNLYLGIFIGVLLTPVFGLGLIIILASLLYYFNTKVVATDTSIILHKGWLIKSVTEIPYTKINNVSVTKGARATHGSLVISTGNDSSKMLLGSFEGVQELHRIIQSHLAGHTKAASPESEQTESYLEELERLAMLKERGHLTEAEYAAEKRRLLR